MTEIKYATSKTLEVTYVNRRNYQGVYQIVIKRAIDIICSVIVFPFVLLISLFVGIAIKIDDGGPVFYMAERIGKDSKKLRMFKFRSMKVNAPNLTNPDGSTYNAKNDSRVTRVGRFLRETSLDEIPQIINVLKGDMSFIGPRASGWEALDSYKSDETDKMKVRPGITGYTQAYYRNSIGVREKRLYDSWYANNVTFWLDVKIFFKTIVVVLKHENIYTNNETVEVKTAEEKVPQEVTK